MSAVSAIIRLLRKKGAPAAKRAAKESTEKAPAKPRQTKIIVEKPRGGPKKEIKPGPDLDYGKIKEEGKALDKKARKSKAKDSELDYSKFNK